jgi:dTDP-4-amino-4,6-dideoxygalactose transaminase
MSIYSDGRRQSVLPVTDRVAANVLALPVYNDMTTAECDGIVEAFHRVRKRSKDRSARSTASF